MKKSVITLIALLVAVMLFAVGCAPSGATTETAKATESVASEASASEAVSAGDAGTSAAASLYDAPSTLYKEGGGNKIGITVIDNVIPHCQAYIEGAKSVIEENGDTAVVLDPGFDAVVQASNIDDFVAQGCVGIVCETIDGEALITSVQSAYDAGVMVVSADFPFASGYENLVCSQVMTPNQEAGEVLAEKMAKDLDYKGNVVILARPDAGSQARADGFRTVVAKYPDMKIIFDGDGGGEVEKANSVMQDILQANQQVNAVICSNDEQAIGAHTAAETADRAEEVKCYGFDAAPEAVDFIKNGKETASLGQQPFAMAKQSALDLYKALKGEDVGAAIKYCAYEIVTAENADARIQYYYTGDPSIKYE